MPYILALQNMYLFKDIFMIIVKSHILCSEVEFRRYIAAVAIVENILL